MRAISKGKPKEKAGVLFVFRFGYVCSYYSVSFYFIYFYLFIYFVFGRGLRHAQICSIQSKVRLGGALRNRSTEMSLGTFFMKENPIKCMARP